MNIWVFVGIIGLVAAVMFISRMAWISPNEAKGLLDSGAILIDVRSPAEFRGGSAEGAVNVPVGEIGQSIRDGKFSKEQTLLLFCASGSRSAMAKRQLIKSGFSGVHNLGTVARARQCVAQ